MLSALPCGLSLPGEGTMPSDGCCPIHCRGLRGLAPPLWVRCMVNGKGSPYRCWLSRSFVDWVSHGKSCTCGAGLSCVIVIMTLMHVHRIMDPLSQVAMGWIPALECLLLDVCGSEWIHLILSGIKWPHRLSMLAPGSLVQDGRLSGEATGVTGACQVETQGGWQDPVCPQLLRWDRKDRYGSCPSLVPLRWCPPPNPRVSLVWWDCI
jgi:hypothetical protein